MLLWKGKTTMQQREDFKKDTIQFTEENLRAGRTKRSSISFTA